MALTRPVSFGASVAFALTLACALPALADPPSLAYIFPAGGQRGATVAVRIGGHHLHGNAPFEMLGPGVTASPRIRQTDKVWFEGPVIPLPASQQKEDYPSDYAGQVQIAADAPLGPRRFRTWTAQGATPSLTFVVGEHPEILETEVEGDTPATAVKLPVTINGRIFPREDVDLWEFDGVAGQPVHCQLAARALGSPLDGQLQILNARGERLLESAPTGDNEDPSLTFTPRENGRFRVRVVDFDSEGLQHYVYRLTLVAGPHVAWTFPLGGKAGGPLALELVGAGLPQPKVQIDLPPRAGGEAGPRDERVALKLGERSVPVTFETDVLDEVVEAGKTPTQLPAPCVANGRISTPGETDEWLLAAKKGEAWELDLRAGRLGSPLDSVLVIQGPDGKEVARDQDSASAADSFLRFTAPADGTYTVRVSEQFAHRGGPAYGYRLRVTRPAPDFRLSFATDAIIAERGKGKAPKFKLDVQRSGGFDGEITLAIEGLPAGVSLVKDKLPAKQPSVQLDFKVEEDAAIVCSAITLRGTADIAGQKVTRTASLVVARGETPVESVRLAVALPTPFKLVGTFSQVYAPRGAVHIRRYKIVRGGYEGPLEISLAERQARHLQGVSGPTITVPPGQDEFDYPAYLPPWMEVGRTSRSCLMAVGEVDDGKGQRHKVSYSSQHQNDQIVILVDPGPLSAVVEPASVLARAGQASDVTVRLERAKELKGPVKLELVGSPLAAGIKAESVTLPADQNAGVLKVKGEGITGTVSLIVRATATDDRGHPVVAEARLEVVGP